MLPYYTSLYQCTSVPVCPCKTIIIVMDDSISGPTFLIWFGPTPRIAISDPELIREVLLSRSEYFDRYESHPLIRQLEGKGLVSLRGQKWAHHRKVLTPTFHMDNLKVQSIFLFFKPIFINCFN